MTEADLRALVREAVARHLGRGSAAQAGFTEFTPAPVAHPRAGSDHSLAIFHALTNVTDACVIEPAVACNHCHYCKTHGY